MSQNLNLIKYHQDESNLLYEEPSSIIEATFISPSLLEEIASISPLVEIEIFEEIGSEESFKADCLNSNMIREVTDRLKEIFIRIIEENGARANDEHQFIAPSKLNELILEFRTLTNVIHLLDIKTEKYADDSSVIVQLG